MAASEDIEKTILLYAFDAPAKISTDKAAELAVILGLHPGTVRSAALYSSSLLASTSRPLDHLSLATFTFASIFDQA